MSHYSENTGISDRRDTGEGVSLGSLRAVDSLKSEIALISGIFLLNWTWPRARTSNILTEQSLEAEARLPVKYPSV